MSPETEPKKSPPPPASEAGAPSKQAFRMWLGTKVLMVIYLILGGIIGVMEFVASLTGPPKDRIDTHPELAGAWIGQYYFWPVAICTLLYWVARLIASKSALAGNLFLLIIVAFLLLPYVFPLVFIGILFMYGGWRGA